MSVRNKARSGFTLIEIMFSLSLIVVLAGLSLWTLKPASSKAPSRGLAMAVSEELGAARQLAISSGRPVALGIPTDSSAVASSVYRLEGWNLPTITWSKGFSGDYPNCGFAAAKWSGGSWTAGTVESVVSKMGAFDLMGQWLPGELADDYIFCFTPDGGLVTNDLPALDGRYVVVVGQNLNVTGVGAGATLVGANDPITIFVSPHGAIEVVTGTPGGNVPPSSSAPATSAPVQRTEYEPGEVRLSNIKVTPRMDGAPEDEGFCVPGQYVTLEVYAYDPEGRGLFAKWKQPVEKGLFTYPDGNAPAGAVLESEVDRMEFVKEQPAGLTWSGTAPPSGGLFRARWGWTVPQDSVPGTVYEIEVDVKDAKGECTIVNPPAKIKMTTAPEGRIIGERLIPPGIWQIVQLNPDGSGQQLLSPVGIPESMPSIDRTGTKMALLQGTGGGRYVKVRSLDGGFERNIAGPGDFTSVALSPDGAWVSYRNNGTGRLITRKVDGSGPTYDVGQSWTGGSGVIVKKSRSGFSQDSRFLIWENQNTLQSINLSSGAASNFLGPVIQDGPLGPLPEQLYAPTSYVTPTGEERIIFSLGNHDPVLITVPWNGGADHGAVDCFNAPMLLPDLDGPAIVGSGSGDLEDDYPSVSTDGRSLILTRSGMSDGATEDIDGQQVMVVAYNTGAGNYIGPPSTVMVSDLRRAVWVPAEP